MFTSGFFWFVMGMIAILVAMGFKAFAEDQGWALNWWKWLLAALWYFIFSLSWLTWGTLIGEMEGSAGFKMWLVGMGVSIVLGVGLWRLLTATSKKA